MALLCLWTASVFSGLSAQTVAQEALVSAGAEEKGVLGRGGDDCLLYWAMGEPVVETYAESKKILSQGFWQGEGYIQDTIGMDTAWYELGVEAAHLLEWVCYPNPTVGPLQLRLRALADVSLAADLWLSDGQGRVLCRRTARELPWQDALDLSAYPAGVYVLTLSWHGAGGVSVGDSGGGRTKCYKIIKY